MKSLARSFPELLETCQSIPLVDCHDHTLTCGPQYSDPIVMLLTGYFRSDILSASSDAEVAQMENLALPLEQRWPIFEKAWRRTCHTGYAQITRRVLSHFYGIKTLTLETVQSLQGRMVAATDPLRFDQILEEAGIVVRIADCWPDAARVLDGTLQLAPRARLAISLPAYHAVRCYEDVAKIGGLLNRNITNLDEYLDACLQIFTAFKKYGAVTFKDQSAYQRTLHYTNPARSQAEEVFNWFMEDPRRSAAYPDGVRPLDDYLFHAFMRMARDLDLPVQIHTGHMAGIRNDITKTNAIHLTSLLELHRDVQFDLFHANYPYSGEILYLVKNYPNVAVDFCWTNIVDPLYCQNLFQQALSSIPHGKVHGYGTDYIGSPEYAWGHAQMARENMAIALANMVDMDYLSLEDAKEVAYAWLFENANQFFRLGV